MKGIANRRNDSAIACEFGKLAKTIRRVLLRKKDYHTHLKISETNLENINDVDNSNNNHNIKNNNSNDHDDNNSSNNNFENDKKIKNKIFSGNIADGSLQRNEQTNRNNLSNSVENNHPDAVVLLHARVEVRSLAVQLQKGGVSACAIFKTRAEIQNMKNLLYEKMMKKTENNRVNLETSICVELAKEQKVLEIGLNFTESCILALDSLYDIEVSFLRLQSDSANSGIELNTDNITDKNYLNSKIKFENNEDTQQRKLLIGNLFNSCDQLRSALRDLGLRIEDS